MATGTYVLAIDWDADGSFSDAHSDVTARTFKVEYKRGRNYASQLVGDTISGVYKLIMLCIILLGQLFSTANNLYISG